jgi:FkbM family methyltransferase
MTDPLAEPKAVGMKNYSQKNEQAILLSEIEAGRLPKVGRFLDIGAFDGETFSNTCALVDLGWSGVMVEPGPAAFAKLLERHGPNGHVGLIHAAVGESPWTQFWENGPYSTTESRQRFIKFPSAGTWSQGFIIPQLSVLRLMELWRAFSGLKNDPDVVSIDTEGTTLEVFRSFTGMFRPPVIIVEHDQDKSTWELAGLCGYEILGENEENLILRRRHGF